MPLCPYCNSPFTSIMEHECYQPMLTQHGKLIKVPRDVEPRLFAQQIEHERNQQAMRQVDEMDRPASITIRELRDIRERIAALEEEVERHRKGIF